MPGVSPVIGLRNCWNAPPSDDHMIYNFPPVIFSNSLQYLSFGTITSHTTYPVSVLLQLFATFRARAHHMIMTATAQILPLIKLTTVLLPVYQIVLQVEERSKVMGIWTRPNGNMAGMIPG